MKIEVDDRGALVLKEVFNGVLLETEEGNRISVCMRDDTFEIKVMPKGKEIPEWFRVCMKKAEIHRA